MDTNNLVESTDELDINLNEPETDTTDISDEKPTQNAVVLGSITKEGNNSLQEIGEGSKKALSTSSTEDTFNNAIRTKFQQKAMSGEQEVGDVVKDIVDFQTTLDAVDKNDATNQAFLKKSKEIKQQELTLRALGNKEKEIARRRDMRAKRAEALYGYFRPILEMDFTYFIPEKKRELSEKPLPKYTERAYGIPLMIIMLIFFTPIFVIFSLFIALMLGINGVAEIFVKFSKTAQKLVISLFCIGLVIGVVFGILYAIQYFTDIQIFGRV